jgi:flavodoxin
MKKNILIAYYSHSGNTRKIAQIIVEQTGGSIHEIQPEKPYPVDYDAVVKQAVKEIHAGYNPPLKYGKVDIKACDTVFVGTPNWCSTIAPPVVTFLKEHNLTGKNVVPFCTHGGGGEENVLKNIAILCPDSKVLTGIAISDDGGPDAQSEISAWLSKIKITS